MKKPKLFHWAQKWTEIYRSQRGFSIIEMLIVGFLTALLAGFTLEFYLTQHNQWLTQTQLADLQQNGRNSMDALTGTIRSAGYGVLFGAPAFQVNTNQDTLAIYAQNGAATDTTRFFVDRSIANNPRLMRKINSLESQVFAEYVDTVGFVPGGTNTLTVTLVAREQMLKGNQYVNYTRRLVSSVKLKNR